ncbi:MAG: hypothetical protein ACRD3P_19630 [Terriglobales bacterium]
MNLSATILQAELGFKVLLKVSQMRSFGRKGWILGAAAVLVLGAGCTGFFVNQPNSISVTTLAGASTFTVAQGSTVQLQATASFNSGSKDVTKSANWQSSSACATVSAGTVKGLGTVSNVTITASVGGVNGSITGSVAGGTGSQLTITSSPSGTAFTSGTSAQFFAALNGTDVTASTTWSSSDTSIVEFSSNTASFVGSGTATITASYAAGSNCATGSETLTVQ